MSRRKKLPHQTCDGATHFVTFQRTKNVAVSLADPAIAPITINALQHFAGSRYLLYDYTVMPDHVHVILKPLPREKGLEPLGRIVQSIKGWTARHINMVIGRRGAFWQDGSYDHIIRNRQDYEEKTKYIWNNPQVAGLVTDAERWPWSGRGQGE